MIKALILDLDGTTVASCGDAVPSPAVIQAIEEAKGYVKIACATGRSINTSRKVIEMLRLSSPCIVSGGAQIVDPISFEPVWEAPLSKEKIGEVIAQLRNTDFFVRASGEVAADVPAKDYQVTTGFPAFLIFGLSEEDVATVKKLLKPIEGINFHAATSWVENELSVQVTNIEASKKHALDKWLEIEKVDKAHVMAIGDSYNDLPLFEIASTRVAMGNAPDEVKAAADWIAPTVEEDGVAIAIRKFILDGK